MDVKIQGTKMFLEYSNINPLSTGGDIKQLLHDQFDVPVTKLSLFTQPPDLLAAGLPVPDTTLIAGLQQEGTAHLRVQVTVRPDVPITVNLVATKQYPRWKQSFLCFETTTVWELKRMLAERVEWRDGNMGELDLTDRVDSWAMHDNGRITADYLVTDGTDVEVCFLHRIIANGFPHDYTDDEGETEEED